MSHNCNEEETPKCPHCEKELKGWSEPSDITGADVLGVIAIVGVLLNLLFGTIGGGMIGSWGRSPNDECGKWFSKRWHYVVPTYQATCRTVQWLRNNEDSAEDSSL